MIAINSCSSFARAALYSAHSGYIHSVYKKTVNIICDGQLLSIQTRPTVASPISLVSNLDEEGLAALRLQRGMEINILNGSAELGGHMLDMTRCGIWNAKLAEKSSGAADANDIESCLAALMPTGGFADLMLPGGTLWKQSLAAKEAAALLAQATAEMRAGEADAAAETLCGLIGLGEGLTPSGDDFLCGVLAAAYLCSGKAAKLCAALNGRIMERLLLTNDISAAFLKCACAGLFSQPVIELHEKVDLAHSRRSFAAIGHSSGADTLSGILYAARL